ncbi:MAG: hypothetical protein ABR923_21640 [Terracidiphilus sp.]|jgi:hypothetical protein
MPAPRLPLCLAILALALAANAQTPPTAYTIVETIAFPPAGSTITITRSGAKVLIEVPRPANGDTPATHTFSLYDLASGVSWSWDSLAQPITCTANHFSGDWGDPFAMTSDLLKSVEKGDLKLAGTESVAGVQAKIYAGVTNNTNIKAWFDEKDGLVLRVLIGPPSGGTLQSVIDIRKVSLAQPAPALFALPAVCASVKPPPTQAEFIGEDTGDSAANWVNAIYGPGSKETCSILVHVVAAKTMAPLNRKYQAAIDTTYDQHASTPPSYVFGVGDDGTSTFSGGGLHEITNQIHNGLLRIDNPPEYFNFGINIPTPHRGASVGLIYRQCFAPVTNLYYIVKDPGDLGKGADWLYAKSGKYAAAPAQ